MKQVRAEVLSIRKAGAYHSLTIVAPEIAEGARPGQFIGVQMPPDRDYVLRRFFSIHQAARRGGWAGTLEIVFEATGPATRWLSSVRAHEFLEVVGPLGTGFSYPKTLVNCLLIGEGHAAASLHFLAQELVARGRRVDMIIGADTLERVFKPIEAKRLAGSVSIRTADGTLGEQGEALDALPDMAKSSGAEVLYAAAPSATLARVADFCRQADLPALFSVEEPMACGVGLCGTCVVPVMRKDGSGPDLLRACVEGPIFDPARVVWDRWRTIEPTHASDQRSLKDQA